MWCVRYRLTLKDLNLQRWHFDYCSFVACRQRKKSVTVNQDYILILIKGSFESLGNRDVTINTELQLQPLISLLDSHWWSDLQVRTNQDMTGKCFSVCLCVFVKLKWEPSLWCWFKQPLCHKQSQACCTCAHTCARVEQWLWISYLLFAASNTKGSQSSLPLTQTQSAESATHTRTHKHIIVPSLNTLAYLQRQKWRTVR